MPTIPAPELERRHRAVRERLEASDPTVDALVVVQKADLYYLSGTVQDCHLLLPRQGTPRLLVRKVLEEAREDSALADVRGLRSLRDLPDHLRELCGDPPWRLGMELDVLPVSSFRGYGRVYHRGAGVEK